jgi:hypothetical protein
MEAELRSPTAAAAVTALVGTAAQINAALLGLSYTNTSDYNGSGPP